jgi:hypothetical protein
MPTLSTAYPIDKLDCRHCTITLFCYNNLSDLAALRPCRKISESFVADYI